jgi:hypothetical protein
MSLGGKLLYHTYHFPIARLKQCREAGGPWQEYLTEQGRRRMEKTAWLLPLLTLPSDPHRTLTLLTGKRYWYQTLFCLYSWSQASGKIPRVVLHDDGTLTPSQASRFHALFPQLQLIHLQETEALLDHFLPAQTYPCLRERRIPYAHLRKLTDIHVGTSGWKLVLDSDLLFFQAPTRLLDWLASPQRPLHAIDCEESYGYPRDFLEKICGKPLPKLLNVGLCGLDSSKIDWHQLEHWTQRLLSTHGSSYYLEQALVALMLAGQDCDPAPAEDYITLPRTPEVLQCRATMHHYVADSKKHYFRTNWKRVIHSKSNAFSTTN